MFILYFCTYFINMDLVETICTLSTPAGMGAISLIRISGKKSLEFLQAIFVFKSHKSLLEPNKVYIGNIIDEKEIIDEVLITYFKHPNSYTGEDLVEISCHGSVYIQKRILDLLVHKGCRLAKPGEFTLRAFINGKIDLSQAEAVSDLIASQSKSSHQIAMQHLKGGFSAKIKLLRKQLLHFTTLLELELDFAEEDVEFANRTDIKKLFENLKQEIQTLLDSFKMGNVFKNGIPVAIAGKPNVGKSTLLNTLLNEERAIVTNIPGTTRDTIEDTMYIHGFMFRFIDTAGLRSTSDEIEKYGIERSYKAMEKAMIILYLIDKKERNKEEIEKIKKQFKEKKIFILINKSDLLAEIPTTISNDTFYISAKKQINISLIHNALKEFVSSLENPNNILIANTRHYEALYKANQSLLEAEKAFDNHVPTDLVMTDIKQVLYHLGTIIGEIHNNEVLASIFNNFCIGK